MKNIFIIYLFLFVIIPQVAIAYIGPGLALGALVVTLGIVALILLTVIAIIYYPIKKMIKNRKLKKLKKNK
jgi:hypothetical protein